MRPKHSSARRVSVPKDIILSVHPKGRNRERLIQSLQRIGAISDAEVARQQRLIHTRKVTDPVTQRLVKAGFFPGQSKGKGTLVGKKIPGKTRAELFLRQGVDRAQPISDVRPVQDLVMGQWKKTPLKICAVGRYDLPRSMWLKFPMSAVSHLSRGNKIFFQGFDVIAPLLAKAGMMKKIPTHLSEYEKCRTKDNPFRIVGRFLEVSDEPQHYSKFSLLSRSKLFARQLPKTLTGKRVGVRGEDFDLAERIVQQRGIKCQLVNVVDPEEAVRKGSVNFAFAHVTSGKTAKQHKLRWTPLFYSSQVAMVHKDALKNPKVKNFLAELKRKGILHDLKNR